MALRNPVSFLAVATRGVRRRLQFWMVAAFAASLAFEGFAGEAKPDGLLLVNESGDVKDPMPPMLRTELEKAGWKSVSFVAWKDLSAEQLRRTRAVVVVSLPRCLEPTDDDRATAQLLTDYVRQGGGLLLTQLTTQLPAAELTLSNLLANSFGTRILLENIQSDPANTRQLGLWPLDRYTFTDRVSEPVNDGVRGVCYQSAVWGLTLYGVLPFAPEPPWRVVLSAGPNSRSTVRPIGLEVMDRAMRPEGFSSDVPLAGVRDFEKGRVAYVGIAANNVFTRPMNNDDSTTTYDAYMRRGWEGCPSDLLPFYLNTLQWISARADGLADSHLVRPEVKPVRRVTAWKIHRGVIGPRTSHSSGASSADDYAAKAKELGLDFLVFLEDFAAMKPEAFESLKADCRRLSTETFLALPGFTFEYADGNHEYIFGDTVLLPSSLLLDPTGKRMKVYSPLENGEQAYAGLHYCYTLLGFDNTSGWFDFSHNPYPSCDARDVDSMAVLTQQAGKTIDRDLAGYALANRSGQSLYPFALCLATSAAELDAVKDGTVFINLIGAKGIDEIGKVLNRYDGRDAIHLYPSVPPFGQTSISNGPVIELVMPRADVNAEGELYEPVLQNWPLRLSVSSDNVLKEVKILDGDVVVRRFLPQAQKTFQFETSVSKERQKHLWVHATDEKGREAVSRAVNCNSWIMREMQCADRNNQLLDSRQKRADGSPFFIGYGGDTAMPDKGAWNGRIRPVGCFVLDAKLGVGSTAFDGSPEAHPQCWMNPYVVYDGKTPKNVGWVHHLVADREGAPHVLPHRVVASSDVLIGDRVLDGVFPLSAEPVNHVWYSVYPFAPSKRLKTTARTTFYLVKPDGVSFYLWDQSIELLEDVPTPDTSPYFFHVGTVQNVGGKRRIIVNGDKVVENADDKPVALHSAAFNKGDYLGFLDNPFGSLAVYSLTDGLILHGDGVNYNVGIKPTGAVAKAGTKFRVRLLLAGMNREVADPAALAAQIRTQYGIVGAPSYDITAQVGRVVEQEYALTLAAGPEGCFVGAVNRVAALPGNLGCAVLGLNDRWTAFFQHGGEKHQTRIVPVEEGAAYAVVRADDDGRPLFIGHPIIADRPELILNVTRTGLEEKWQLEIHNPTDQTIESRVQSSPHVLGIQFNEQVQVPSGASLIRAL